MLFRSAIEAEGGETTTLHIWLPDNNSIYSYSEKHFYFPWKVKDSDMYNNYENYLYWDGSSFVFSPNTSDNFTIAYIYYR